MALPAGWYPVEGDPAGTHRYWDGDAFTTGPKRNQNARDTAGFIKPNSAAKWRMATTMSRLVAAIIDYGAPVAIVLGIANGMGATTPNTSLSSWTDEPKIIGIILACMLVNQVVLVGIWGISLGRTLLGLRVVDVRDKDRSPGLIRAFLRFALSIPSLPATAMLIVLGKRRGLNDLAAGTAVVYA